MHVSIATISFQFDSNYGRSLLILCLSCATHAAIVTPNYPAREMPSHIMSFGRRRVAGSRSTLEHVPPGLRDSVRTGITGPRAPACHLWLTKCAPKNIVWLRGCMEAVVGARRLLGEPRHTSGAIMKCNGQVLLNRALYMVSYEGAHGVSLLRCPRQTKH